MPKPFPPEFRRDVIAVAGRGEASISQVARDFGIPGSCLQRWLGIADRDDGLAPPAAGDRGEKTDSVELRELRRRNNVAVSRAGCTAPARPRPRRARSDAGGYRGGGAQVRPDDWQLHAKPAA